MSSQSKGAQAPIIPRKIDQPWHDAIIKSLPCQYQQKARDGYQAAFKEAWDSLPDDHCRENQAARSANIRLRVFAEKLLGQDDVNRITQSAGKRR